MSSDEQTPSFLDQQVELLGARDWQVAGAGYEVLARAGQAGLNAALEGLSHPSARVRRGCADFFDHQGSDACVEALCRIARLDPAPSVRRAAVHSRCCQHCKPAPLRSDLVEFLMERALSDENARVRREAVYGLSLHEPDDRIARALRTILGQETDPNLARDAHYGLQRHDPEYRQAVIQKARTRPRLVCGIDEQLDDAVQSGDLQAVSSVLQRGAEIDARCEYGTTALMAAAGEGQYEAVRYLIEHGANVNVKNRRGITPLMAAAYNEGAAMTTLLLDAGADVNARDAHGRTALFHAVQFARVEVVEVLLARGADPHLANRRGKTALQVARREVSSFMGTRFDYSPIIALLERAMLKRKSPQNPAIEA